MPDQSIHAVIVATGQHNVLLPKRALIEVTTAQPTFADGDTQIQNLWFAGFVKWNSVQVPVIDFGILLGVDQPVDSGRVAILNCVGNKLRGTAFGIKCTSFPHLTTLSESAVSVNEDNKESNDFLLSNVRVGIIDAVIPNMEKIEEAVALTLPK